MLLNASETHVIDHLGWADGKSLWRYDLATETITSIDLDSEDLRIHRGSRNLFVVQSEGGRERPHVGPATAVTLSVRDLDTPGVVIGFAAIRARHVEFGGDEAIWAGLPRSYLSRYDDGSQGPQDILLHVLPSARSIDLQWLGGWFNEDHYDLDYQGLVQAIDLPDQESVLITIQRSSEPVVWNLRQRRLTGSVPLSAPPQHGNPSGRLLADGSEIWLDDYRSVARIDARSLTVIARQDVERPGSFSGFSNFDNAETTCLVPRPFSGDVVMIDRATFRQVGRESLGGQPIKVTRTVGGKLVARDWKTGRLLLAHHGRRRWLPF